jgi:hypothetical protein
VADVEGIARVGGLFKLLPRVEGRAVELLARPGLDELRPDERVIDFAAVDGMPRLGGAVEVVRPRLAGPVAEDLAVVGDCGLDGVVGCSTSGRSSFGGVG